MRKIKRMVAKQRMKDAGITQICKKHNREGHKMPSKFSLHWRQFAKG